MLVRLLCFVCLSEMDISSVVVLVTRAVNGILEEQYSLTFSLLKVPTSTFTIQNLLRTLS